MKKQIANIITGCRIFCSILMIFFPVFSAEFYITYSTHRLNDVIYEFPPPPDIRFRPSEAKKRMALADPEWHASRLKMPVLITSSDIDEDCPEKDINNLFYRCRPDILVVFNEYAYDFSERKFKSKNDNPKFLKRKKLVRSYLGKTVEIHMDRPLGYVHKKEKYTLTYPINYGFIPDVILFADLLI